MFKKWFVIQYYSDDRWYIQEHRSFWSSPHDVCFYQCLGPYKTEEEAVSAYLKGIRHTPVLPLP